jgi:hypothetical protein
MNKIFKKISEAVRKFFASPPPVEKKSLAEQVEDVIQAEDALEK